MSDAAPRLPIRYTPAVETPSPDEVEIHEGLKKAFNEIIGRTHEDLGHALRGVHAKSHALLQGWLTVHADLPPERAQGIFVPGRRYPVLVRLSSIPGDALRDSVSLPRGFAVKAIGVEGERLPGSQADVTQDFLMATGPSLFASDAAHFLQQTRVLAKTTDRAEWAKAALSAVLRPLEKALEAVGGQSALLKALGGYPRTHPLGERYFTQVPVRFGDYIAKLDVVPESDNFRAWAGREVDYAGRENALREEVAEVLKEEGGAWTLRAQFCRDLDDNPIENAAKVWPEEDNPYLPLATIAVPAQESWSQARSREVDDETAFSPWHGIAAHRPLGNIMRARAAVYPFSSGLRSQLNGCPIHEPREAPHLAD